jgi:hypothetical protein
VLEGWSHSLSAAMLVTSVGEAGSGGGGRSSSGGGAASEAGGREKGGKRGGMGSAGAKFGLKDTDWVLNAAAVVGTGTLGNLERGRAGCWRAGCSISAAMLGTWFSAVTQRLRQQRWGY